VEVQFVPRDPSALPSVWPPAYPRHRPLSVEEARALDRRAQEMGIPALTLMEHAAVGVAALAEGLALPGEPVLVLCGPGNNGGDGYGCARLLAGWGRAVRVLRLAPRLPSGVEAAREAALAGALVPIEDAWRRPEVVAEALAAAPLVVDAIFGVGAVRLDGPYPAWIEAINVSRALRLAVDVPSGLDADSGLARPAAVLAHVTATMAAPKRGLVSPSPGALFAGRVVEVDIGVPATLLRPLEIPRAR
jgi:NAD(P)H-hydrate epimerase